MSNIEASAKNRLKKKLLEFSGIQLNSKLFDEGILSISSREETNIRDFVDAYYFLSQSPDIEGLEFAPERFLAPFIFKSAKFLAKGHEEEVVDLKNALLLRQQLEGKGLRYKSPPKIPFSPDDGG